MKTAPWALATFSAALLALAAFHPAQAQDAAPAQSATPVGSALAADMGCLNCHGTPPRGDAPTIERLARHSESLRSNDEKIREAAQKLRSRRDAVAHSQLSQADAERLVRWLADGAK